MPWDAFLQQTLLDVVAEEKPRLLFVGYGETDEWAHDGRYDLVLQSAHNVDGFIRELWDTMQAIPQYRDQTTFIVTTDHGRGDGPENWKNHDWNVEGAENMWIAVLGPDTPALGERRNTARVTQSQIASTVAALFGKDWRSVNPTRAPRSARRSGNSAGGRSRGVYSRTTAGPGLVTKKREFSAAAGNAAV